MNTICIYTMNICHTKRPLALYIVHVHSDYRPIRTFYALFITDGCIHMVSVVMSTKSKMVVFIKVALCLVYLCSFMIPWTSKQLLPA